MNKQFYLLSLTLLLIDLNSFAAFTWGGLIQKREKEKIKQEYTVQPKCTIRVYNTEGSITIRAWPHNKIEIKGEKIGTEQEQKNTSISALTTGNEASITTKIKTDQKSSTINYVLWIPEEANLKITQTQGPIKIKGVTGSIDVSLEDGLIEISESANTVSAKNRSGDIKVEQKKFVEPQSIFLETQKGNITLSLPRETQALLHAKSPLGSITSDHLVTLAPLSLKLNKTEWEKLKKNVEGSLGGPNGGAPITLEATKGNIIIKEY